MNIPSYTIDQCKAAFAPTSRSAKAPRPRVRDNVVHLADMLGPKPAHMTDQNDPRLNDSADAGMPPGFRALPSE
jgi:hypothetical protein